MSTADDSSLTTQSTRAAAAAAAAGAAGSSPRGSAAPSQYIDWWEQHRTISPQDAATAFNCCRQTIRPCCCCPCWPVAAVPPLTPNQITHTHATFALKYRLTSFYEVRETVGSCEPHPEGEADLLAATCGTAEFGAVEVGSDESASVNIRAPLLREQAASTADTEDSVWDMVVLPDQIFVPAQKLVSLAEDQRVLACPGCQGTKQKKCNSCRQRTTRWDACGTCGGQGSVSWQAHYWGADYDNTWDDDILIKSGRLNRYLNCQDCAGVGFGKQSFKCRACLGRGAVNCTMCNGSGAVRSHRKLLVRFHNLSSWAVVHDSPIPHHILHGCAGLVMWEEEAGEASAHAAVDRLMEGKSARLRARHASKLHSDSGDGPARILLQRQTLSIVPIYRVQYRRPTHMCAGAGGSFWLCGEGPEGRHVWFNNPPSSNVACAIL